MNDTSELWSTPWRRLHQHLANGPRAGLPAQYLAHRRAGHLAASVVPAASWLVRARSRRAQAFRAR